MARAPDAEHLAQVEAWRAERYRRLRQPMSWLSLVGLEWLREGDNRLGADRDVELRLPSGPRIAGRLRLDGGRVTAAGAPSSGLMHDGEAVEDLELINDLDAPDDPGPTLLELGSLRMCLVRRADRFGLRIWDTAAAALREFRGVPHYPVDPAWRLVARFEPGAPGETFALPDVLGDVEEEPLPGTVILERGGTHHRIRAIDGGAGQLWLVFGDATNGDTTYRGGRFVYTDPPRADGTVTVDFNRAYNPPCVFSPYATCPLPPPENRLPIRIEAGERWDEAH
jgi:uncharacterized protein (DUF1684 family)